ncbi:hypothetical protein GII33_14770 [Gordonia pseudamarae]|jgi:hypothetical protein|nr:MULTISPECIES: hypothetical protein [Gordonia]MBD0024179.1 hypothetical protein [Gordonia sp. (in: high G+C Gram-positive bacteria)]QHN27027.1 hypothetical protein GII33_14770 [Gordonia pseudamarae]
MDFHLIRRSISTTLLAGVLVILGLQAGAGHAAALRGTGMSDTSPAAQAIRILSGNRPDLAAVHIPPGFAAVMGYRPVVSEGLTVNPNGSCSSPVDLPRQFEPFCRAHDFGYDLLRYADREHRPLGGWARLTLDHTLIRQMHASCTDPTCHAAAETARIGLGLNSWRQRFGPPISAESPLSAGVSLVGAVAGLWTAPLHAVTEIAR